MNFHPIPPLVPWVSDFHLSLILPVAAYWFMSLIFWYIDKKDWWPQYRIHTPAEFKQRNRVSKGEVLRSVIFQQVIQTAVGLSIGYLTSPGDLQGREDYDVTIWAGRIRKAFAAVPWVLAALGIDAKMAGTRTMAYSAPFSLGWGTYKPSVIVNHMLQTTPNGFATWEIWIAKLIYVVLEPAARFGIAIFFGDSWQYFWHRAMHSNRWMYRNMHAHHHRLYVPYAFGAFYNTLTEAFILDTIGTTLALMLSGLTIRQMMWFSTVSVMKGVDDHCGYRLPWDPLQWWNEQDTAFHDVHHQSWGIKSNYSQLYTTFWDHVCGTLCPKSPWEVEMLYAKGREAAEKEEKQE